MPAFAINGESRVRRLAGKSNALVIEPLEIRPYLKPDEPRTENPS